MLLHTLLPGISQGKNPVSHCMSSITLWAEDLSNLLPENRRLDVEAVKKHPLFSETSYNLATSKCFSNF